MNNKTFKYILILLALFTFMFKLNIVKANNLLIIEDDANLLSDNEISKLEKEMKPLTSFGNIAFKTISTNNRGTEVYARDYYHSKFGNSSGTLFLIDMDNRVLYIFSDGSNFKAVTSDKAYIITDNVYKYATKGQYYKCAVKAFKDIKSVLNGETIREPMRYISNILISIIISAFICYLVVLSSGKTPIATKAEVLKKSKVSFKVDNVTKEFAGRRQFYSPRVDYHSSGGSFGGGSSSSGGSFGGGGFSGGSSGGGGGHRF